MLPKDQETQRLREGLMAAYHIHLSRRRNLRERTIPAVLVPVCNKPRVCPPPHVRKPSVCQEAPRPSPHQRPTQRWHTAWVGQTPAWVGQTPAARDCAKGAHCRSRAARRVVPSQSSLPAGRKPNHYLTRPRGPGMSQWSHPLSHPCALIHTCDSTTRQHDRLRAGQSRVSP